jgi:hypothetical protein
MDLVPQRRDPVVEDRERKIVGHRDVLPSELDCSIAAAEQPVT